tara:strand:- start:9199 stop:9468 length:270 start_codon:yes stop_codon:yes gene_type:complete
MEDFIAEVVLSKGDKVIIKNFAHNVQDLVDNLVQIEEVIDVINITRLSDNKVWRFVGDRLDFKTLREARAKVNNEVNLKNYIRKDSTTV